MSQIKKGASLTYINLFLSNIIGLVLTPFIIRSLGNSEYGLYTLIGSFVAYLTLLDLGLSSTIVRYVAKYRAHNDKEGEKQFLSTTMWIYLGIAFLLMIVGFLLYSQLDSMFKNTLTGDELGRAKLMFIVLVFNLCFTIPGGAFEAICNGYQYFVFPRVVKICKYVLRTIMVFAILSYGGKAISLVVIDTVMNVLVILASFIFVMLKLKVKISLNYFDKVLLKEVFSYSFWVFVYGIVHLFQWNAGQVVLGMTTSTIVVAVFGVGIMLGGYFNAFGGALNDVLIPKAMQMVVENRSGKELTKTMVTVSRLNGYVMFLILTSFILVGKQFIELWVGVDYVEAWKVAIAIMLGMTLLLFQVFGNTILEALKKNRFKSLISLSTVGLGVVVGYFFSKEYGMMGMIIPLSFAMVLNGVIMNSYFIKIFDFQPAYFFKEVLYKQVLVYGLLLSMCYYILQFINIGSWFIFLGISAVYLLLFVNLSYFLLMNEYEKSFAKQFFLKFIRK
ncbi:MAG TPA: oligosaccharide flippase family protein [Flavobacterium sp.]